MVQSETTDTLSKSLSPPGSNRLLLAGFAVSILILIVTAGLSAWNHEQLVNTGRRVVETHLLLAQLAELRLRLTEAQDAERGFIITGTNEFLDPFQVATNKLARALDKLPASLQKSPGQSDHWESLLTNVQDVVTQLIAHVEARQKLGFEEAKELVETQKVKHAMDAIRSAINTLVGEELDLLAERQSGPSPRSTWPFGSTTAAEC